MIENKKLLRNKGHRYERSKDATSVCDDSTKDTGSPPVDGLPPAKSLGESTDFSPLNSRMEG